MQIRKAHLVNFCQHADLAVEFPPGIVGILGGNGRGKSNLIKAFRFALIGESGNVGSKVDDLNWRAAQAGESGYVELEFDVCGQSGKIKRAINTTRAHLKFGSEKPINSSNAATARVLDIIGSSRKVLEDIIFVLQGQIEDILFEYPSDRTKKLQGLFGIENAEKLRQLLHQEVALITTDPVDERIKELQKQVNEEIDPQLRSLNEARVALDVAPDVDAEALKQLLQAWTAYSTDAKRVSSLRQREQELTAAIVDCADILRVEKEAAKLQELHDAMIGEVEEAKIALASLKHAQAAAAARSHMQVEYQRCEAVMREQPPPAPQVSMEQIAESRRLVAVAREHVDRMRRYLKMYQEGKSGPCELCGQLLQFTAERVAEAHEVVETQPPTIQEVEEAIATGAKLWDDWTTARGRWEARQNEAVRQMSLITAQLGSGDDSEIPDVDERKLSELVKKYDAVRLDLARVSQQLSEHRDRTSKLQGELSGVQSQMQELSLTPPCSEEEMQAASDTLNRLEESKLKQAEIDGQLHQLHSARVRALAELEGLKKQAGTMKAKRAYKQLCTDARDILHRDVLPQRVMRQYLAALNKELNSYLQTFGVPFSCTITDELAVICTINGFGDKPAERLSGGQKVMLGIAFRFAIYNMFAAKLGFVILDEPTTHLDNDNVDIIADMLRAVRGHALSSGLQVIVPTHERALWSAFDHAVHV